MLIDTISLELFSHTEHWKENGQVFLHDRFFMLRDFALRNREFLVPTQPYRLQEGRVVLVKRGAANYSFNLVNYHFEAGDLVVFLSDMLIEKQDHSPDFAFDAFSFSLDNPLPIDRSEGFVRLRLDERTMPVIEQHLSLLWTMVHAPSFPHENVRLLTDSLLTFVNQQEGESLVNRTTNRREETLRRFVALVSRYAARERNIPFYADRLCIAPHYLSTLVKQTSGRTVMQWINQTAVKEVKVWLAYSDESAAQIADRLHFPCPSSLTKFFKRETGMTPGEYRTAFCAPR